MSLTRWIGPLSLLALSCADPARPVHDAADQGVMDEGSPYDPPDLEHDHDHDAHQPGPGQRLALVTLDGAPVQGATLTQGGAPGRWTTDAQGLAAVTLTADVQGQHALIASHPEARIKATLFDPEDDATLIIALTRYAPDNPRYLFPDSGEPARRPNTSQCGHCHQTINDAWFASPHRTAASNPWLHDLYEGAAAALDDQPACEAAGGRWVMGHLPGQDKDALRCYLGDGVLPALSAACDQAPCGDDGPNGACAACHAPAINGPLGERSLRDARGLAFDYGVSCGLCHAVDRVDLDSPLPGVAGRLRLTRPSEPAAPALGAGGFLPLLFGPSHDSPNPRMGNVQRDHFRDGALCAGCHQYDQPALRPDAAPDPARWPQGRLPVHSTYDEWRTGPLGEAAACPDCHMPPDPMVANGADLQRFPLAEVGVQGGWRRPPGAVRAHAWWGPRQPQSRMLELAAALEITKKVTRGDLLEVEITTRNVGAGHAIPTGEPLRALYLVVEASCGDQPQPPAPGGDVIPDHGGALELRGADQPWERWPQARPGDQLRVLRRPGGWRDYDGFGAFARDARSPQERGLPIEHFAGASTVIEVDSDGLLTLDAPLPPGDLAMLIRDPSSDLAGAPGAAFARVMVDKDGRRMVPHFLARDIASDNRLLPHQSWASQHRFYVSCDAPEVSARLLYRPAPRWLALERRWDTQDTLMAQARR